MRDDVVVGVRRREIVFAFMETMWRAVWRFPYTTKQKDGGVLELRCPDHGYADKYRVRGHSEECLACGKELQYFVNKDLQEKLRRTTE